MREPAIPPAEIGADLQPLYDGLDRREPPQAAPAARVRSAYTPATTGPRMRSVV
jgi:hypothetical protein